MFMKEMTTGHLVEILNTEELHDPFQRRVAGRYHYGEEMQDEQQFDKGKLVFQSGESLPACWTDPHYRDDELKHSA